MESLAYGFKLLKKYKIPTAKYAYVKTKKQALSAGIGYLAVLKADYPAFTHKTDKKIISLDIDNNKELCKEWDRIARIMKGRELGFVLQEQLSGPEFIIGGKRDAQFGAVTVFGLGGVLVEYINDIAMRIGPVSPKEAMKMIEEVRGKKLLQGGRGYKPVNKKKLGKMISTVSKIMEKEKIKEIDLNPVMSRGNDVVAVDVRVVK